MGHHKLLLQNVQHYKILSLFESYLRNISQQVNINTNQSKTGNVLGGVPQGCILDPPLFWVFMNDLPIFIRDSIRYVDLYANDRTLYHGLDKDMLENNLQHSLNLRKSWCPENGMKNNLDKAKLMLISSRQKRKCMKDNKLALVYDNFDLQLTSFEKVLGFHIDDNLP